uniref:Archaemetzincin-2 n=1 Tax=Labrus bergylta TaxID=56723 RepID=A0A3Q3EWH8_9LABR
MKVIQHSVVTLQTALISNRQDLAEIYSKYTEQERCLLEEGFHSRQPGSLFLPITVHSDADWIPAHPEEPQDFESFFRDPYRKTPDASHNTIYIQTIGSFGEVGAQTDQFVEWLREYGQAFFYGLSVTLLPAVTVAETGCSFRVNSNSNNLQILTGDLLRFLEKKKPKDAFCIVGLTMIDLYPSDSWNFVSGKHAPLITNFLHPEPLNDFFQRSTNPLINTADKKKNTACCFLSVCVCLFFMVISKPLVLLSFQTMTHEIGHMFGIKHCQWLNFCLRKLQASISFKIAERYQALLHWVEDDDSQTSCQPVFHLSKPTEAFQTYRLWLRRCLDILKST